MATKIKILLIILLCNVLLLNAQVDKNKHYIAGASISSVSYVFLHSEKISLYESTWIAGSLTLVSGAGKEFFDSFNGGRFSWSDYKYTCLGGITTIAINILVYKITHRKKKKKLIKI